MNIGRLNKRIQIIERSWSGQDDDGFEMAAKERIVWECWAKVSETSGTELIKSGSEFVDAKKRFFIRHTTAKINEDMIIRYNGEGYEIKLINTYGDNHEYTEIWTTKIEQV